MSLITKVFDANINSELSAINNLCSIVNNYLNDYFIKSKSSINYNENDINDKLLDYIKKNIITSLNKISSEHLKKLQNNKISDNKSLEKVSNESIKKNEHDMLIYAYKPCFKDLYRFTNLDNLTIMIDLYYKTETNDVKVDREIKSYIKLFTTNAYKDTIKFSDIHIGNINFFKSYYTEIFNNFLSLDFSSNQDALKTENVFNLIDHKFKDIIASFEYVEKINKIFDRLKDSETIPYIFDHLLDKVKKIDETNEAFLWLNPVIIKNKNFSSLMTTIDVKQPYDIEYEINCKSLKLGYNHEKNIKTQITYDTLGNLSNIPKNTNIESKRIYDEDNIINKHFIAFIDYTVDYKPLAIYNICEYTGESENEDYGEVIYAFVRFLIRKKLLSETYIPADFLKSENNIDLEFSPNYLVHVGKDGEHLNNSIFKLDNGDPLAYLRFVNSFFIYRISENRHLDINKLINTNMNTYTNNIILDELNVGSGATIRNVRATGNVRDNKDEYDKINLGTVGLISDNEPSNIYPHITEDTYYSNILLNSEILDFNIINDVNKKSLESNKHILDIYNKPEETNVNYITNLNRKLNKINNDSETILYVYTIIEESTTHESNDKIERRSIINTFKRIIQDVDILISGNKSQMSRVYKSLNDSNEPIFELLTKFVTNSFGTPITPVLLNKLSKYLLNNVPIELSFPYKFEFNIYDYITSNPYHYMFTTQFANNAKIEGIEKLPVDIKIGYNYNSYNNIKDDIKNIKNIKSIKDIKNKKDNYLYSLSIINLNTSIESKEKFNNHITNYYKNNNEFIYLGLNENPERSKALAIKNNKNKVNSNKHIICKYNILPQHIYILNQVKVNNITNIQRYIVDYSTHKSNFKSITPLLKNIFFKEYFYPTPQKMSTNFDHNYHTVYNSFNSLDKVNVKLPIAYDIYDIQQYLTKEENEEQISTIIKKSRDFIDINYMNIMNEIFSDQQDNNSKNILKDLNYYKFIPVDYYKNINYN
jgi:hypothetical protein